MSGGIKKLRVMSWNTGMGSRRIKFIESDNSRIKVILDIVKKYQIDVIALQEMANKRYEKDLPDFDFSDYIKKYDEELFYIHFQPTVSLGGRHCYPYGKIPRIFREFGITWLEYGLGIWIRSVNNWLIRNLYANGDANPPAIEVQRPMPHPLYMGEKPAPIGDEDEDRYGAGRDEEDRPVLWSRLDTGDGELKHYKIYFLSLHFPTLIDEEKDMNAGVFTNSQKDIAENVLRLSNSDLQRYTVDRLGTDLRIYCLKQIISQAKRIEEFWGFGNTRNKCVFILAGDFNFYHTNETFSDKSPEEIFLDGNGFVRAKLNGYTRTNERLVDNIWVYGAQKVTEYTMEGCQIENSSYSEKLKSISNHYPVIADLIIK